MVYVELGPMQKDQASGMISPIAESWDLTSEEVNTSWIWPIAL